MTDGSNHENDNPRTWQRLASDLRGAIERGELKPGAPAPSIAALVQNGRSASRETCARALRSLADSGALIRRPGLGYFIPERP